MKWYYAKGGAQHGPVSSEQLQAKITAGEVLASDLVWRDGMKDWLPLTEVGEFANYLPQAATPAAPAASSPPASPDQAPPAPASAGDVPGAPVPGAGKATAAMVLGIVATVFGLCGCYGMLIAVPCGILAIVFGSGVKRDAKLNPALEPELGKAKVAVITGWIGLALSLLLTVAVFVFGFSRAIIEEM